MASIFCVNQQKPPNNRVQHDAAGAAPDLGAIFARFPYHYSSRSSDATSGAADAERWACVPVPQMPLYRTAQET